MAVIEKIKMQGFKSFAKSTEVPLGKDFSVILGPNGSGKSARYDTEVLLNTGELLPIGEIVERALNNSELHVKLNDGIYTPENPKNIKTLGLNPETMEVVEKDISAFIKREGEPYLYEIYTNTGKTVCTTGCHPVMIFRDGKIVSEVINNLKEGDFIAAPRIIRFNNKEYLRFEDKAIDENLSRLLGYLIGDGYIRDDRIEFVNADRELLDDFLLVLNNSFKLKKEIYKRKDGKTERFIYRDKEICKYIKDLFRRKYGEKLVNEYKIIPPEILLSPDSIISNLLASLFDCDGYMGENEFEFSTKNKKLANQVQLLLLRFGIISVLKEKEKYASNTKDKIKRKYYSIYIREENLKKLHDKIPLKCIHKKDKLFNLIKKEKISNPNIDVLPEEVNKLIKNTREILAIYCKPLRKEHPSFAAYNENRCCPSRNGIKKALTIFYDKINLMNEVNNNLLKEKKNLIKSLEKLSFVRSEASKAIGFNQGTLTSWWAYSDKYGTKQKNLDNLYNYIKENINDRINKAKEIIAVLEKLSNSDIFWERIVEIKKVKGEPYVYDLTIPNCHNFIGNGLFVHNSNITDAICFVLGRLSAKSLRADKSANLIYNGGKKGEAAKEAEVSILFDNSNKLFPLNVNKVKITRSVRENGQSKYKINDEIRTRQQVIDLLAAGKINPDGYNIVLQGDITHVTEMPTEERRKVIEDISGIGVYEDKKEKAINELTKVDGKLNEASIVLKERETYLSELKKDRDHAAKYKDLEGNIKRNKATFLHVQISEKQKKREELESKIKKNQEEADKIRKTVEELREEVNKSKEEISSISKEIEEKGEKEQVDLHREIETVKEQKARDQTRMESLGNELNRINERKKQLEIDLREINDKLKQLEDDKNNLTKKRKILAEKESIIEKKLGGKKGDNKDERELDEIENKLYGKQSVLEELNNKKTILLRDKDRLETQINSLNKLGGGEELKKLKEFKEKFKDVSNKLNSSLNDNDGIVSQLSKARGKLREISEEQARMSVRDAGFKESAYGDLALNKIKELRMKGVYGTIAELGEVDKKYSMALEVAAGSRIKSVVVEDDSIAAKCIKYLKDNKLGVATFLPLNKIKSPEVTNKKVGYGLALNLIKFDNKFSRAFGYVFGSTVVVENLNQARNIGIGKDRMVTLDGDLVESSGAMIGGFRRQKTGFKQLDLTKNLEELNGEIGRLREIVDSLDKKKVENEDNVYLLRNDKAELEGEIIKLEKSFGGEEEKREREAAIKNLNSVEKELNGAEANYNKLFKEAEELKDKRNSLRESVSKVRGNKESDKLDSEFRQAREERIVIENELKNIEIQIRDGLIPERENIIRIIKEHEKEILEFQKESDEISDRLLKNLNLLKEKERNEKEFYSNFKNLFNKRNKLSDEIQKKELKSASEYSKVRTIEDRNNSFNIDRAKVCAELEGLNVEYEQFKEIQLRKGVELDKLKEEIRDFEKMMNNLGNVNLRALEIYDEIEKEYNILQDKAAKLKVEKEDVLKMINEIEGKKGDMFMKSYSEISRNFERIFSELTDKGTAHLILDDKDNPFNGGLKIMVRIAKGKYLDIKSLSGGEKTLTALAFIFAIQEYDPGHFYVFDEVDAALDKTNSSKLAKLLAKYSDKAQYIVISHNDNLISEANQLYGVSMTENGMSKVISLKV